MVFVLSVTTENEMRILDFLMVLLTVTAISFWNDGNKFHTWTLIALVGVTSVVSYVRGLKGK